LPYILQRKELGKGIVDHQPIQAIDKLCFAVRRAW